MATTTVTAPKSAAHSTIGLKLMMAVSGLYFIFFVLFHMYGNLKILVSNQAFDEYAHHLRTMFEPILPYSGFLWLFRLSLILAVVAHVYSAVTLWGRASGARSSRYMVKKTLVATASSKAMRWGGIALLVFIVFHLLHFTIVKFNVNPAVTMPAEESPAALLKAAFQMWWMVLIYLVALVALALHLHHGTWSAMQTLGFTNTAKSRATSKLAGVLIALVAAGGFAIPPLAILFGIVK